MLTKARRIVLGNAAAAVDHAVGLAMARSGVQKETEFLGHEQRLALLRNFQERYEQLDAANTFFREPRAIEVRTDRRFQSPDGLTVTDVHWQSDYETFLPEVSARYNRVVENRVAAARLVTHGSTPRPIAILIHGYMGGVYRLERRVWPLSFLRSIGMDAALFVLPFHGTRRAHGPFGKPPAFPSPDPRRNNEGIRQTMADLRDFIRWLYDRGHPHVGAMGMSLGGFSTALAATLEPTLSFAVPIIPLASFADVFQQQGHLGTNPIESQIQHQALERVFRHASPLHRKPVIPLDRILIIAGENDRITPPAQARKLASHFRCRIETWPGGHLFQFGRTEKFRSIGRFLMETGVVQGDLS